MTRVLVVGLGSIGQVHARLLAPLCTISVCDLDEARARDLGAELSCPFFTDIDQALAEKPDGVLIALPTHLHYDAALKALESGASVLVEKPLCDRLALAESLSKQGGDRLFTVCNMRFHNAVRAMRDAMPKLGQIYFARAQFGNYLPNMRPGVDYSRLYVAKRETGGGALMDCIHEIDYLIHLLGGVCDLKADLAKLSDLKIETEDYAGLILRHENGARSEVHLDYLQHYKRRGCEIIGENGTIIWHSMGKNPEHCKVEIFLKGEGRWRILYESDALYHKVCLEEMNKGFVARLQGEDVPELAGGEEGCAALRVIEKAYRQTES